MQTVSRLALEVKDQISRPVVCPTCGYCRLRHEGACPSCAAERRLAEAVAALRAEDDYDALNAAAYAITEMVRDAPIQPGTFGARNYWQSFGLPGRLLRSVREVRDPIITGGRDDDDCARGCGGGYGEGWGMDD